MWEQYQAPDEQPSEQPSEQPTEQPQPLLAADEFTPVRGAPASSDAKVLIGGVLVIAIVLIGAVVASSSSAPTGGGNDYSDWYDCIADEEADGSGFLSPADLCDIGHERPPDYVDTYEYDPYDDGGFDSGY